MNRKDAKARRERRPGYRQPQAFFASLRLCGSNPPSAPRWTGPRVVLRQFPAGHGVHRSDLTSRWRTRGTRLAATKLPPLVIPAKALGYAQISVVPNEPPSPLGGEGAGDEGTYARQRVQEQQPYPPLRRRSNGRFTRTLVVSKEFLPRYRARVPSPPTPSPPRGEGFRFSAKHSRCEMCASPSANARTQALQSTLPLLGPRFRGDDTIEFGLRSFRPKARHSMHALGTREGHSPI